MPAAEEGEAVGRADLGQARTDVADGGGRGGDSGDQIGGADRQQHGVMFLFQLVESYLIAERCFEVNLDTGTMRHHAVDVLLHRGFR